MASATSVSTATARTMVQSEVNTNLSRLLLEEKIHGPADSDPRARRDDYHYFKGPYIHLRDLSQFYRPIMIREYSKVSDPELGDWPQFRLTGIGKSPFVQDSRQRRSEEENETDAAGIAAAAVLKEQRALAKAQEPTQRLQRSRRLGVHAEEFVINEDEHDELEPEEQSEEHRAKHKRKMTEGDLKANKVARKPTFSSVAAGREGHERKKSILSPIKMTSVRANSPIVQNTVGSVGTSKRLGRIASKKNYYPGHGNMEVVASGINMSMVTSNVKSMTQSGGTANGLGANTSQTQSKEMNSLKRKIFERKIRPPSVPNAAVRKEAVAVKEMRPGYCENCKDRFDDFDEHTKSRKHKKFALNDGNFTDLDALLKVLGRRPRSVV